MWVVELLAGLIQSLAEHGASVAVEGAIHVGVEKMCEPEAGGDFVRVLAGAPRSLSVNDR